MSRRFGKFSGDNGEEKNYPGLEEVPFAAYFFVAACIISAIERHETSVVKAVEVILEYTFAYMLVFAISYGILTVALSKYPPDSGNKATKLMRTLIPLAVGIVAYIIITLFMNK